MMVRAVVVRRSLTETVRTAPAQNNPILPRRRVGSLDGTHRRARWSARASTMREGTTSFERADAVCVDDAFSSSSSSGGGFGRDGRKSFRDVVSELSTGEKVAFALAALPALPLILCFTPLLAVHVCVSKLEGVDRDDGASRAPRRRSPPRDPKLSRAIRVVSRP